MRIGVLNISKAAQAGGSHTLTRGIHEALLAAAPGSQHTFVLFTEGRQPKDTPSRTRNVEYRRLRPTPLRLGVGATRSLARSAKRKLANPLGPFDRHGMVSAYHETRLRSQGIDFVWSLTSGVPPLDIPYVPTILDLQHRNQPFFPEVSANGEWDFREKYYRRIIGRAAMVFVGTNSGKCEIERFYGYPSDLIKVIPLPTPEMAGVATARTDRVRLSRFGIEPGYVFYPAQFWSHKNHVALLRALRKLASRDLPLRAVFVGSDKGNLRHIQRTAVELGVGDRTDWLGFVSAEDMAALYRNALLLAFPTFFGPDNLPPLEAFALGCPVVSSRVHGAEEQLGDAALLFDPVSSDDLANAIERVATDAGLRAELVARGVARATSFTAAQYVETAMRHFDEFQSIRACWPASSRP